MEEYRTHYGASTSVIAHQYAEQKNFEKEAFYRYIQAKEMIIAEVQRSKESSASIFGLFDQTQMITTLQSLLNFLSLPNNDPHKTIGNVMSAWEKSLPSGTVIPEVVTNIKTLYGNLSFPVVSNAEMGYQPPMSSSPTGVDDSQSDDNSDSIEDSPLLPKAGLRRRK